MTSSYISPLLIGIDPDTDRSGWASIDIRSRTLHLERLPLPELLDRLDAFREDLGTQVGAHFVLEDIWSTAHNWHVSPRDSRDVVAKKGYHLGRCAMVGEILRDAIARRGFYLLCQPPLAKCWRGADRKITHEELLQLAERHRLAIDRDHLKRSHQDERDAALLALHHLSTPLNRFTQQR